MFLIETTIPHATICFHFATAAQNSRCRAPFFRYPEHVNFLAPSPGCQDDVQKNAPQRARVSVRSDPLIGSDAEGRMFTEDSRTVILSLHGAGIVSSHKLIAEQELILRSKESDREAEIRVVGEIGSEDGRYTYGVAF